MIDTVGLQTAVQTASAIFCATREGVDATDRRRCLLAPHLHRRCEALEENVEVLTSFGLACLARLPEDEC